MKAAIALVIVVLASCVAPTPYQPLAESGGYQSQRTATNMFVVEFLANGVTSKQATKDFALLRGAELAQQHKFRYFTIEGDRDLSSAETFYDGSTSSTTGNIDSFGGYSAYTSNTPRVTHIFYPGSQLRIKCYTSTPAGHVGRVYTAESTIEELRAKYSLLGEP